MKLQPEMDMIAKPTDITRPDATSGGLAAGETPLQRQIILWQRELVRRAEARQEAAAEAEAIELPSTESEVELGE